MIPYTLHPVSMKWMLLITVHQNQEISTCVQVYAILSHMQIYTAMTTIKTQIQRASEILLPHVISFTQTHKIFLKKDTDLFHYHKDLPLATPLQSYARIPSPASQAVNLGNHCKIFMAIPYFCNNSLLIPIQVIFIFSYHNDAISIPVLTQKFLQADHTNSQKLNCQVTGYKHFNGI